MRKPIIGISASMTIDKEGEFIGCQRSYVNDDYIQSVIRAGGIPFVLPMSLQESVIEGQTAYLDGLILSGGHDVNPMMWGEEPHRDIEEIFPERDCFDRMLVEHMMNLHKPILGICRGEQILNVIQGGTLYQDLSHMEGSYIKHNQKHSPGKPTHSVQISKDSWLHSILGDEALVNSFHHLAVKQLAKGFKIAALSKDGVIEAIEREEGSFVLGLQWHPEMLSANYPQMQKIFDGFIEEATKTIPS